MVPLILEFAGTATRPWKTEDEFKKYKRFGIGLRAVKDLNLPAYEDMVSEFNKNSDYNFKYFIPVTGC